MIQTVGNVDFRVRGFAILLAVMYSIEKGNVDFSVTN